MNSQENNIAALADAAIEAVALVKIFDAKNFWSMIDVDADGKYHEYQIRFALGAIAHRHSYSDAAVVKLAVDAATFALVSKPADVLRSEVANW